MRGGTGKVLGKLSLGRRSGSRYAVLGSHPMRRAGAACCDMLVGSPAMFSEQISVEMGHPLLEEGAETGGKNLLEREMAEGC